MIRIYENGNQLVQENRALLDTNPYLSMFFVLDAAALTAVDKINYAVSAGTEDAKVLAMKVEPYSMLLFGAEAAIPELLDFLVGNGYEIRNILGGETVCDAMVQIMASQHSAEYYEALAMDFMEATEKTEPSSPEVEIPVDADLDELVECEHRFVEDFGLDDKVNADRIRSRLPEFRILRQDGRIACMASVSKATPFALKIANVYTRPEYRGRGLARKVVNTLKNEILAQGKIATLNVDKKNPVSNHLYLSLGFRKVFSQGEYRKL